MHMIAKDTSVATISNARYVTRKKDIITKLVWVGVQNSLDKEQIKWKDGVDSKERQSVGKRSRSNCLYGQKVLLVSFA